MRNPNDKKYASFRERWDWVITFMVLEDKFVHEVLMLMSKSCDNSIGTMGVSVEGTRIELVYCEKFVESLSDAELRFVITHEIYHLILHHCTVRLPLDKKDRKLYNVAADLAINCLIPQSSSRTMPIDDKGKPIGVLPSQYGFADKLSMEQYVQLLRQKQDKDGDNGKGEGFDNHDGWEESEVIKEIVRSAVSRISKDERVWGSMPGDLKAVILAAQETYVSWERYLKHHLGNMVSASYERTMKRPDRRFGYPYAGKKRGYSDRKLVAIDRSGSTSADLPQFLAEVNKLAELQPVDMVVFDDGIRDGPFPFDRRHSSFEFKGGGGTNFKQVFDLASERRYQSLIVLTDGCAGAIEYPTGVKDVLWVLVGGGDPPVTWGDRVRIIPKGQPQVKQD